MRAATNGKAKKKGAKAKAPAKVLGTDGKAHDLPGIEKTTVTMKSPGGKEVDITKALESFSLEQSGKRGEIPERTVVHLIALRALAVEAAGEYGEACKKQAKKYAVNAGALKRYINARDSDKLGDARAEADDLLLLLGVPQ